MLSDGQRRIVAFTLLAQLRGPEDQETETGANQFTQNGEPRNFAFFELETPNKHSIAQEMPLKLRNYAKSTEKHWLVLSKLKTKQNLKSPFKVQ